MTRGRRSELVEAVGDEPLDGLGAEDAGELVARRRRGGRWRMRCLLVEGAGSCDGRWWLLHGRIVRAGGVEEADEPEGEPGADELHDDEHRRRRRFDAGEAVRQRAGDGDGRVGEAGRRGEEVGAADPHADGDGHDVGAAACARSRG